ncbi:hypothetical protein DBT_1961 [Dissulfuribacter thermophilus]|uniref:Uncharacterized protein n=1 Tax=Dissulfuribacter thermophilus TaxID=1156395 RepID=A0A1B9F3Z1_9BACT|nr:hypothetical protein DBT_1961 [Dissulfuribacter thermophilus]
MDCLHPTRPGHGYLVEASFDIPVHIQGLNKIILAFNSILMHTQKEFLPSSDIIMIVANEFSPWCYEQVNYPLN